MDVLSTFYVFLIDCLSVVIFWRYVSLELHICLTSVYFAFRNIFLGEVFSSYVSVHNDSNQPVKDIVIKVELLPLIYSSHLFMTYLKDRTVDRKCDQQINILYGLNSKQEV